MTHSQELLIKIKTEKPLKESHQYYWTIPVRSGPSQSAVDHPSPRLTVYDDLWPGYMDFKSISVGDFEKTKSMRFKVKRMHY